MLRSAENAPLSMTCLSSYHYTLVGLWVTGLAPVVFIALKLAEPKLGRSKH
jgi:hypothetical protein